MISPRLGAGVRRHIGPAVSAAWTAIADVGGRALLEAPDDVAAVGGVAALEGLAARGRVHSPAMKRRKVGTSVGVARGGRGWRSRSWTASVGQPRRRTYACRSCWSALSVPPVEAAQGSSARIALATGVRWPLRQRASAATASGWSWRGQRRRRSPHTPRPARGMPCASRRAACPAASSSAAGAAGSPTSLAAACAATASVRTGPIRHSPRAKARAPSMAVPGTRVAMGPGFEQRQRPVGTVRGPDRQHAPVVLAQVGRRLAARSGVAVEPGS